MSFTVVLFVIGFFYYAWWILPARTAQKKLENYSKLTGLLEGIISDLRHNPEGVDWENSDFKLQLSIHDPPFESFDELTSANIKHASISIYVKYSDNSQTSIDVPPINRSI